MPEFVLSCILLARVVRPGRDENDASTYCSVSDDYTKYLNDGIKGTRIGVYRNKGELPEHNAKAAERVINLLKEFGVDITEFS